MAGELDKIWEEVTAYSEVCHGIWLKDWRRPQNTSRKPMSEPKFLPQYLEYEVGMLATWPWCVVVILGNAHSHFLSIVIQ